MEEEQNESRADFSTFTGVFRPITLTILGAMLYLREGWLVGESGLLGALLIIAAAGTITGITSLSLASIASNVRVRPGGAFAIIAQALGLEAGGAIGIPLYIAQAASAAMYIYAFAESWAIFDPNTSTTVVAGSAFTVVALLAWRSSSLALRAQGVMLFVVIAALLSAALGLISPKAPLQPIRLLGTLPDADLITLFAIFFPAFTGIMVGAGMSGSLKNPRRSIPRGTLMAWAVTLIVYVLFAFWYSVIATTDELVGNRAIMIERALIPEVVLVGLLCSTLMAALSSLVAAPRLLQAMAEHRVVPAANWLSKVTASGEPRNAVVATTALAAAGLAAGSLDAIAPIITSFFIMTYMAINGVVYVERKLGMISFRPTFRVAMWIPLVGATLCLLGLSMSSPFGGIIELSFVLMIYGALSMRRLETPWETVRSGIAVTFAAWAARNATQSERSERAWKPDMLVPAAAAEQVKDMRPLVETLARRNGSIRWVGLGEREELPNYLDKVAAFEIVDGLYASWTQLRTRQYMAGIGLALDALQGALFPPNLVVVDERRVSDEEIAEYLSHCRELSVGLLLWQPHQQGGLGQRKIIDVWLSDRSPEWRLQLHLANLDLPVLVGFLMAEAWGAKLRLRTIVRDPAQQQAGQQFLESLIDQARLPRGTSAHSQTGDFLEAVRVAADADINLFGMPPTVHKKRLHEIQAAAGGSCIWLLDLGTASALA